MEESVNYLREESGRVLQTGNELPKHDKEYDISVNDELRKDVSAMCNLSQGIRDAEDVKIIMNMHRIRKQFAAFSVFREKDSHKW